MPEAEATDRRQDQEPQTLRSAARRFRRAAADLTGSAAALDRIGALAAAAVEQAEATRRALLALRGIRELVKAAVRRAWRHLAAPAAPARQHTRPEPLHQPLQQKLCA